MATRNNIPALIPIHPGSVIKEEIKERGISQKMLAKDMGIQESHLSEIIKGKRTISKQVADNLERALGIPSIDWMNLQIQYDYDAKREEDSQSVEKVAYEKVKEYANLIDVRTLTTRLGFRKTLMSEVLDFLQNTLNLPEPEKLNAQTVGIFKKSGKVGKDPRMIMTWIVLARYFADTHEIVAEYDEQRLSQLIPSICEILHSNEDTINRLTETFAEYGILFGIIKKVDGASIDGYSFEHNGRPCIMVTTRFDRIDNLAFAVMHELGHIVHKDAEYSRLDLVDYDHENVTEKRANAFAANALIPDEKWEKLPKSALNPKTIQYVCTTWAETNGYNKWIVLGRLSHETGMYKFKNDTSRKIS